MNSFAARVARYDLGCTNQIYPQEIWKRISIAEATFSSCCCISAGKHSHGALWFFWGSVSSQPLASRLSKGRPWAVHRAGTFVTSWTWLCSQQQQKQFPDHGLDRITLVLNTYSSYQREKLVEGMAPDCGLGAALVS